MEMQKVGAPPLSAMVINKLLDLLSTDDSFRELFKTDVSAALEIAGYQAPDADDALGAPAASPVLCLQLPPHAELASKEKIAADREKLQAVLAIPVSFIAGTHFEEK